MKQIHNISAVLIVKNSENSLAKTLHSLESFKEVIVYDNGSTDASKKIAQSFSNVILIEGTFDGFGTTKNRATSFAKNDWIFFIDSDEVVSKKLLKNFSTLSLEKNRLYFIKRINFYKTQQIKHCWGDDTLARLYNKKETSFTNAMVHESLQEKNLSKVYLHGNLLHYPYNTLSEFLIKADRYSTAFAKEHKGKKNSSPTKAFLNGSFSFFKTYVLKRGFLDGYAGLVIAFSHMVTNFFKYIKLYELNKEMV